jgi:hypothetical protein
MKENVYMQGITYNLLKLYRHAIYETTSYRPTTEQVVCPYYPKHPIRLSIQFDSQWKMLYFNSLDIENVNILNFSSFS